MPKCKVCKKNFTRTREGQVVCSFSCSIEYPKMLKEKKEKEAKKERTKAIREFNRQDIFKLTKTAKKEIQKYVRLRDRKDTCISCGKTEAKQWDGGHYMSAEYYAAVKFNTLNIHKQCSHCNDWNNANIANYRVKLIEKIGLEKVEWLESQKQPTKYTADYLNRLIKIIRKKIRKLEKKIKEEDG